MTTPPPYVVHHVDEKDVTVDWFFGTHHPGTKATQLVLVLIGWFFLILPIVITGSALVHRDDDTRGWWGYHEGFAMWDRTIAFLAVLTVVFIVGFLVLHLLDRASAGRRRRAKTYDEHLLEERTRIAAQWYATKFGPEELRTLQRHVRIEPYGDVETYELRGLYRTRGVD